MNTKPKLEHGEWWCFDHESEQTCLVTQCIYPREAAERAAAQLDDAAKLHMTVEDWRGNHFDVRVRAEVKTVYRASDPVPLVPLCPGCDCPAGECTCPNCRDRNGSEVSH